MGVKYYINRGLYTVRGFTPILSVAVVVALALAAVFGSMSLANPAMAAIGQPADAELTERADSPQAATLRFHDGQEFEYDISNLITGGGPNYNGLVAAETIIEPATLVDATDGVTIDAGFGAITLQLTGATLAEDTDPITGRIYITLDLKEGDNQRLRFDATLLQETDPTVVDAIEDLEIQRGLADDPDTATEDDALAGPIMMLDVSGSFMDGVGTGGDVFNYTVTSAVVGTGGANVEIGEDDASATTAGDWAATQTTTDGKFALRAVAGAAAGVASRITVAATGADDGSTANTPADASFTFFVDVVARRSAATEAGLPKFTPGDDGPGAGTSYTVEFQLTKAVNTRQKDLIIEFDGDYGIPSSIRNTSVAITTNIDIGTEADDDITVTPEDVTVDGEKILISLGDMDERDGSSKYDFAGDEIITVHFRQSAGITNPTEAKGYNLVAIEFGDNGHEYNDGTKADLPNLETTIVRKISLSEEDGGLDTEITATGKGFKNGTSLTVFRDAPVRVMYDHDMNDDTAMMPLTTAKAKEVADGDYKLNVPVLYFNDEDMPLTYETVTVNNQMMMYVTAPNGRQDSNDDTLCLAARIGGDDVGKCDFKVTHPTFTGGINYVNARDGRSNHGPKADTFELTASISVSPTSGSPGERMLVQVVDFPPNSTITMAQLARNANNPICTGCGSVDGAGAGTFSFIIPNWPSAGTQELKVFGANDVDAAVNVTISGPQITVTPGEVLANQRVSLVGTGFSPGSVIANADDDLMSTDPIVSIGGKPITGDRINDGQPVRVDNGGNWSASVDLPLAEATTAEGTRLIRVTDSRNRTGGEMVTIPGRSVTITPDSGRVGTIAVIRGTGFPSKNDEGNSFNIEIVYETASGQTTVSATPDASGRFEVQLRIPTTAAIPSSNTVKVSFTDADGVVVPLTIPHEVPEGVITLSVTSGGPGSTVGIMGEGFKSFVPISSVKIGNIEITPAPKPSTDVNGMMEFDVLIPGLDVGIQTIEVQVGQTTSSVGFTVTESGINPGDIKAVAEAVEPLGDNLDVVWHFNNDTKEWTFYDGMEGSNLTHMITGETYLLQVKATVEVILNRDTRNLTCANGNCWNQIVW